jgi:hypothetical protein
LRVVNGMHEGNGQDSREHLWQAAQYQHPATGQRCDGKIHVLRHDDAARTVCGRDTAAIGGQALATQGVDASTCQGCRNSIASRVRAAAQQAQWAARQEREHAEWWRRYDEHLRSSAWAALRSRVLFRADHICEGCGQHRATQVHHLTYRRLGHEMLFDLVAVCDACHAAIHPVERNTGLGYLTMPVDGPGG